MTLKMFFLAAIFIFSAHPLFPVLMIDDFEHQDGATTNKLGFPAGSFDDGAVSTAWWSGPKNWPPVLSGSQSGSFTSSNRPGGFAGFFERVAPTDDGRSLADLYNYHKLAFLIRTHREPAFQGYLKIGAVKLEGTNWQTFGQVGFSNYNGGSRIVSTNVTEIVIPIADFTNDVTGASWALSKVGGFSFSVVTPNTGHVHLDNFRIIPGIEITTTDSSNLSTSSNQERYSVSAGGTVRIKITERSNQSGCSGRISLSPSSQSGVTNQPLTDAGGGRYFYDWNISGRPDGTYAVECMLNNSYATDRNGSSDAGADLSIVLYGANQLVISGMGSYNQNYSADTDNAYLEGALVRVWIREMNNTTGATGFIDISPFSRTGVTNTNMIEAGSGQYDFVWNTTGLSNGSYSLETRLKKTGMSNDMNGYNDSGTDLVVRVTNGLKISAISSSAGDDADGSYTVSDKIEIRIREKNYATGCQAYITLYAAGRTNVNKALMSGLAGGEYAYVWDTKGLPAGTYFAETMITNSSRPGHQPDRDGYDDSGPDLLLALAEELSPKDKALVLWNNYPKPGEAVKIFMNSPDPAGQASSMVSVRVYTLSGTLITEILNVPLSRVPRPVLWYGDRNGKTLPNGVYAIHVKGAGIDAYKRVYLYR